MRVKNRAEKKNVSLQLSLKSRLIFNLFLISDTYIRFNTIPAKFPFSFKAYYFIEKRKLRICGNYYKNAKSFMKSVESYT